jgi:hypothetical protein
MNFYRNVTSGISRHEAFGTGRDEGELCSHYNHALNEMLLRNQTFPSSGLHTTNMTIRQGIPDAPGFLRFSSDSDVSLLCFAGFKS